MLLMPSVSFLPTADAHHQGHDTPLDLAIRKGHTHVEEILAEIVAGTVQAMAAQNMVR